MKPHISTFIVILICSILPGLTYDSTYCTFENGRRIEADTLQPKGLRIQSGTKTVFTFGQMGRPEVDEAMTRYHFEVDTNQKDFDVSDKGGTPIKIWEYHISMMTRELSLVPFPKIQGRKDSDSTWVLDEWVSRDYKKSIRLIPHRFQKKSKKVRDGFRRVCRETK